MFNIPLARKYRYSSISGQLLGSSNIIGKGGIIIKLGERKYLTDSTGKFYFDKLLPDSYYLTIDKKTLGQGVISTTKLPIQLALKADSTKNVSISLIKTGGLEGTINLMTLNSIGNEVKEHPIILVRLFNEQESFLTQVSKTLNFSFKEMRPSDWQIEALLQSDEDKFTVIDPIKSIKIEADTVKKVDFTVKPIERKIYFSQNNFNLISKKEEPKKEEKKKEAIKVEPISKLKTKADSLNATSDTKKLKQDEAKKPIKTVQNNFPKKTFDRVSVKALRRKTRVVIQTPKSNIWKGFDGKIVWYSPNKTSEQNIFSPNTSSNDNTATDTSELTDTEPNRNLKNKERQRR